MRAVRSTLSADSRFTRLARLLLFCVPVSWEFSPLYCIYFIYNHGTVYDWLHAANPAEDHVIARISYLKQL